MYLFLFVNIMLYFLNVQIKILYITIRLTKLHWDDNIGLLVMITGEEQTPLPPPKEKFFNLTLVCQYICFRCYGFVR